MNDKILFFSDVHIRETGSFLPWNQVVNGRGLTGEIENIMKGFKFISSQIVEHQPRLVIFAGDWHHTTDSITTMSLYASGLCHSMILDACEEVGCEFWMFSGQHDIYSEIYNITSIGVFSRSCKYIPTEKIKDIDGFKIGILPYLSCNELALSTLSDMSCKVDLISTHLNFGGSVFESGKVSDSILSPKLGVPCVSGDIHRQGAYQDVTYCGSLYQNKFAQDNTDHVGGVVLFDMNSKKIKSIPNTVSKHYVRVKDLKQVKKLDPDKVVLQVVTSDDKEEVSNVCEDFEYMFIPRPTFEEEKEFDEDYVDTSLQTPKEIFRSYVEDDNPEAVKLFDRVMSGKRRDK